MYCALYTAPKPGINPKTMASAGFEPVGAGGGTVATFAARHGSQYNAPPTSRVHSGHIGLPQLRQYPVASTLLCTAQVIAFSCSVTPKSPTSAFQLQSSVLRPFARRQSNSPAFLTPFLCVLCVKSFASVFFSVYINEANMTPVRDWLCPGCGEVCVRSCGFAGD